MRPLSACKACRNRQKKCIRPRRGTTYVFYTKRGLECDVAPDQKPVLPQGYAPLADPKGMALHASSAAIPDRALSRELIDLFFIHVHFAFPNMFHMPSFKAAFQNGTIPRVLFFAVIGLSARFSGHQSLRHINPWHRGRPYAQEAEKLLDLHDTSIFTIQACMLLAANFIADGEVMTECVYLTIACRMAMLIDLPNLKVNNRIEQEVSRRVWWSLVTTDTWNSSSVSLPRAIQIRHDVPLPISEHDFLSLDINEPPEHIASPITPFSPNSWPFPSLLARFISLNTLLYEVNRLNAKIAAEKVPEGQAHEAIGNLAASLGAWLTDLPPQLRYTEENMSFWGSQGSGPTFVNMHMNYHHIGQLLFYSSLGASLEIGSDSFVYEQTISLATKCKQHAADLCDLIWTAKQRPETDIMHSLVGHDLVTSSTVQIHTLLFSPDDKEIATARSRLERNFEMITDLHKYWPIVSVTISKLQKFHNACLRYKDATFHLDRWMLQFILEFSQPIQERSEDMLHRGDNEEVFDQLRNLIDA
ncbi:Zn(2)-C6 fungal-type domain-containing protein [Fusarium sp. LHS14.1]|nr:Zn(2)-C6 fungal-type domain-containing protein [Fusarium sp. LHS14.1]